MRFLRAHIFGYGKFAGFQIDFYPGFQIIYGPNESGKTTLFNFILDMIFGQKASIRKGAQNSENFYIFKPWNVGDYKGELCIRLENKEVNLLDDQRLIHLRRNFGERGSLLVFEGISPRDITSRYPLLPNGEVAFAQTQLGVGRDLFVSVATISMKTLDYLGGPEQVKRIKEHLISLVDTGSLDSSLREIVKFLGGGNGGYLKSLHTLREHLEDKSVELLSMKVEQMNLRKAYLEYKRRIGKLLKELEVLQGEVEDLKKRVDYSKKYMLWRKKNDAKALIEQIDALTAQYFTYSGVKDFPLHLNARVILLKSSYDNLASQRSDIQRRLEELTSEIDKMEEDMRVKRFKKIDNIYQLKEKFNRLSENILKIETRLEVKRLHYFELLDEIREIEESKKSWPGIDKISQEFIDIYDGMINLYNTLVSQIREKEEELKGIEKEIEELNFELHPLSKIFGGNLDISSLVIEYENLITQPEKITSKLQTEINKLSDLIEIYKEEKRTHFIVGAICFILSVALGYLFLITHNNASILFASITFLAFLYCFTTYWGYRRELVEKQRLLEERREELNQINFEKEVNSHPVALMMSAANTADTSELLGLHRKYVTLLERKRELEDRLCNVKNSVLEYQDSRDSVFLKMSEEVSVFNFELKDENDIQKIRQELIRLKDRAKGFINKAHDLNNQIFELQKEIEVDERNLNELKVNIEREVYDEVMPYFVDMGIVEQNGVITLDTFVSYFNLLKEVEEIKKRVMEKRKERESLYTELRQIEESMNSTSEELQEFFKLGGVGNFDEWNLKYEQAKRTKEIQERLERTKMELDLILGEYTLEKIDEVLGDFVPGGEAENLEELERVLQEKQLRIEKLREEIGELKFKMGEISSKMKNLCEIEEEIQNIGLKISQIEDEEEAINYAITTLTRIAQDRDSQILSRLEKEVSSLFSRITKGKYSSVKLERDLSPLIYCSEQGKFLPLEEINLSQGTIDQLYFSIRAAILKAMCAEREKLPMILDEPFMNYDTERLTIAIQTLHELGKEHQIILFTCREDLLSLAEILKIPVINVRA